MKDTYKACFTETQKADGYQVRRAATDFNVPLFTNARLATAFIRSFTTYDLESLEIKAWDEY